MTSAPLLRTHQVDTTERSSVSPGRFHLEFSLQTTEVALSQTPS